MASEEEFDKCIEMVKTGFLGFKKVHDSVTDLSKKVKSYEEKLKSSEDHNCKLQQAYEAVAQKLTVARNENSSVKQAYKAVTQKLTAALNENSSVKQEYEAVTQKLTVALNENSSVKQEYEAVTEKLTAALSENNSVKEKIAHLQLDINRKNNIIKSLCTSKDSGESSAAANTNPRGEVDWKKVPGGVDISIFIPGLSAEKPGSTEQMSGLKRRNVSSDKGAKKLCKRSISSAVGSKNIASCSSSEANINEPGCSYSTTSNDEDIKFQSTSNLLNLNEQLEKDKDEQLEKDKDEQLEKDKDEQLEKEKNEQLEKEKNEENKKDKDRDDFTKFLYQLRHSECSIMENDETQRYNNILSSYLLTLSKNGDEEYVNNSIINFLLNSQSYISLETARQNLFGMTEDYIAESFFQCKSAGSNTLCEGFIQKFFEILKTSKDFTFYGGGSACITFVTLCKKMYDFDNIKQLLCSIVKLQKDIIPFLFASVFAAYPELKLLLQNPPSNWTGRAISNIVNKKPLEIPDEIWKQTAQFFKDHCHFPYKTKNSQKLLDDIIFDIKRDSSEVEFSDQTSCDYITAILLLSMYHGKEWTQEQLFEHHIFPLRRAFDGARAVKKYKSIKILLDTLQGALNENMVIKLETV